MTLLIDVGNSAIKWASLASNGELRDSRRQLHRGVSDLSLKLIECWRGTLQPGAPMIACNVAAPRVVAAVTDAACALGINSVRWLHTQRRFDGSITLVNGYRDPLQLGADRWHALLGACALRLVTDEALVVVNAGTATTVDCIDAPDADGKLPRVRRFVGGVIAPGVRLMLESLARETAGLPAAQGAPSNFPDNTDAAIITGVLDAQAGLVQRVWHRFAVGLRARPRLILTGGSAQILLARLSIEEAAIEDNLVLRGLALRAELVTSGHSISE
ncbi:MAG: type III pantothenate kinase [Burkholderiaceae bacterium]